ncbi:Protein Asterix [Anthophora quadrimaculata]
MNSSSDPRRPEREIRYKPTVSSSQSQPVINSTTDYVNMIAMVLSMSGLMMKLKWCTWAALYCSCISFANSKITEDNKQVLSSFMLSISAIVMSYLQNPQPMTPPWAPAVE